MVRDVVDTFATQSTLAMTSLTQTAGNKMAALTVRFVATVKQQTGPEFELSTKQKKHNKKKNPAVISLLLPFHSYQ